MTIRNYVHALQKTAIFGAVGVDELKSLAACLRKRQLKRGEILFTRGEKAAGLYVIVSGSIRAFRESQNGREQTIHVETAGATLAEVAVFDGGTHPSTTMAEEDTTVLFLQRDTALDFLRRNPDATLAALRLLAGRLRAITLLLEGVTLQDVGQRLAQLLLERAAISKPVEGRVSFVLKGTHQRIAADLGTVREVITRHLHRFASEGLIKLDGRNVTILDVDRLRAMIQ